MVTNTAQLVEMGSPKSLLSPGARLQPRRAPIQTPWFLSAGRDRSSLRYVASQTLHAYIAGSVYENNLLKHNSKSVLCLSEIINE